ncbi:hypothetical protein DXG01_006815 [Tephrocybe rancida]|nr:hypothetical protein DXG01_006815 [Tephrocybe rancida]
MLAHASRVVRMDGSHLLASGITFKPDPLLYQNPEISDTEAGGPDEQALAVFFGIEKMDSVEKPNGIVVEVTTTTIIV